MNTENDRNSPTRTPGIHSTSTGDTSGAEDSLGEDLLGKLKIRIPGYRLLDVMGRGGQATVYKAVELSDSRMTVAIKILHAGPYADVAARERLRREVLAMQVLKGCPNIVCVFDSGQTDAGHEYLIMSYIDGQPLDQCWRRYHRNSTLPEEPAEQLMLFKKICDAVGFAHRRGITHRDLSPSNILVDADGEPHILDFGLARTAFDRFNHPDAHTISVTGQFIGKLAYASPEQARGNPREVDIRTDVYALGVLLYQIVTGGRFPYEVVGNLVDVLNNIIHAAPVRPSEFHHSSGATRVDVTRLTRRSPASVNQVIEAIVLKALEKDPQHRYESANDLARDVENYLSGTNTQAKVYIPPKPRRRSNFARAFETILIPAIAFTLVGLPFYLAYREKPVPSEVPKASELVEQKSAPDTTSASPPVTAPEVMTALQSGAPAQAPAEPVASPEPVATPVSGQTIVTAVAPARPFDEAALRNATQRPRKRLEELANELTGKIDGELLKVRNNNQTATAQLETDRRIVVDLDQVPYSSAIRAISFEHQKLIGVQFEIIKRAYEPALEQLGDAGLGQLHAQLKNERRDIIRAAPLSQWNYMPSPDKSQLLALFGDGSVQFDGQESLGVSQWFVCKHGHIHIRRNDSDKPGEPIVEFKFDLSDDGLNLLEADQSNPKPVAFRIMKKK